MLVVAKVAIQIRTVMRRCMRVGRFYVFGFFRQFCRGAMAGHALFHGHLLRLLGLAVAALAVHAGQLMSMTTRKFSRQIEVVFGMASLARRKIHRLGIRVFVGQHFFLHMAGCAVSGFGLGRHEFGRGPEKLDQQKDHQHAQ